MKKIPTLFERTFENHKVVSVTEKVFPGMEWVLRGEGVATVKYDGSCCAFIRGKWFKRYDAKHGKTPPKNAIPCCDPDPVTGHWPHWIPIDPSKSEDRWFVEAILNSRESLTNISKEDRMTFEAIGPHFQNNPHHLEKDVLIRHGEHIVSVERSFEGILDFLERTPIEGIVFWKDGEPQCKIKRKDFGFAWPV